MQVALDASFREVLHTRRCQHVLLVPTRACVQGDLERSQSMPISPLCDRSKEGVTKSQVRVGVEADSC